MAAATGKKCFILEGIFNPLLPLALIWLIFDGFFIGAIVYGSQHGGAEEIAPFSIFIGLFFMLLKKLQTDIYADTMYLNDLRPQENRGYSTEYKGL